MDNRDLYQYRVYYAFRAKELMEQAAQERLAGTIVPRERRLRFYYPAMVRFGHWLIASGLHLQKRYGDLCELQASAHLTAHRNA